MKKILLLLATAYSLAACDDFFEKDISRETVNIVAPVHEAIVPEGEITFCWDILEGAQRYRLVVVTPSFDKANAAVCDLLIMPDSAAVSCAHTERLGAGNYEWSLWGLSSTGTGKESVYAISVSETTEGSD